MNLNRPVIKFTITFNLIKCLSNCDTTSFQFNLNKWQTIDKNRHIITTFICIFNRNLVRYLNLFLHHFNVSIKLRYTFVSSSRSRTYLSLNIMALSNTLLSLISIIILRNSASDNGFPSSLSALRSFKIERKLSTSCA